MCVCLGLGGGRGCHGDVVKLFNRLVEGPEFLDSSGSTSDSVTWRNAQRELFVSSFV